MYHVSCTHVIQPMDTKKIFTPSLAPLQLRNSFSNAIISMINAVDGTYPHSLPIITRCKPGFQERCDKQRWRKRIER